MANPYGYGAPSSRTAMGMSHDFSGHKPEDEVCKVNGPAHRYTRSEILNATSVILICECGDVQWKDRPKPETT